MEQTQSSAILVWARYSRYPWWPAFCTGGDAPGFVNVRFFGKFEFSTLTSDRVRPFSDWPEFDKKDLKNKSLQRSISSARRVSQGHCTLEEEMKGSAKSKEAKPSTKHKKLQLDNSIDSSIEESGTEIASPESIPVKLEQIDSSFMVSSNVPDQFDAIYSQFKKSAEKLEIDSAKNIEELLKLYEKLTLPENFTQLVKSDVGKMLFKLAESLSEKHAALFTSLVQKTKGILFSQFFGQNNPAPIPTQTAIPPTVPKIPPQSQAPLAPKIRPPVPKITKIPLEINNISIKPYRTRKEPASLENSAASQTSSLSLNSKLCSITTKASGKKSFKPAKVESTGPQIDPLIKARVIKKLGKVLMQIGGKTLQREAANLTAKNVHELIKKNSKSLNDYKRFVVFFVRKKEELANFLADVSNAESLQNTDYLSGQLMAILLK